MLLEVFLGGLVLVFSVLWFLEKNHKKFLTRKLKHVEAEMKTEDLDKADYHDCYFRPTGNKKVD